MFKVDVAFPYFTGLPSDVVVNTFHFAKGTGTPPTTGDFDNLRDHLKAFYGLVFSSVGTNSMAPWIDQGAVSTKVYDLDDPIPRSPVYSDVGTYPAVQATNSAAPLEAAVCISYQATPTSGLPQARRRGRIFIGGLGIASTIGNPSSFPLVTPQMITACAAAGSYLISDPPADDWF